MLAGAVLRGGGAPGHCPSPQSEVCLPSAPNETFVEHLE